MVGYISLLSIYLGGLHYKNRNTESNMLKQKVLGECDRMREASY